LTGARRFPTVWPPVKTALQGRDQIETSGASLVQDRRAQQVGLDHLTDLGLRVRGEGREQHRGVVQAPTISDV